MDDRNLIKLLNESQQTIKDYNMRRRCTYSYLHNVEFRKWITFDLAYKVDTSTLFSFIFHHDSHFYGRKQEFLIALRIFGGVYIWGIFTKIIPWPKMLYVG